MIEKLLNLLKGVRRTAAGWKACCPAHDDTNPSLKVDLGSDGRILLHCHAGCPPEQICKAVGLELRDLYPDSTSNGANKVNVIAEYDYRDEKEQLLFQTVRLVPKSFRQRRPDPDHPGEWIWKMGDTRRVLYRLPELKVAITMGQIIFVVEGEKDVDALVAAGLVATCNPLGADPGEGKGQGSKWLLEHTEILRGATSVVVIADKDEAGRRHARYVAGCLRGAVKSVRLIELPDRNGARVKDAADWLAAGGTKAELEAIVAASAEFTAAQQVPTSGTTTAVDDSETAQDKKQFAQPVHISAATRVAELTKGLVLFHDANGRGYAQLQVAGHTEIHPLESAAFRDYLARLYYTATHSAINRNAIADALMLLVNRARFDGVERQVYLRVAPFDNGILIDLGDPNWQVLEITASGCRVLAVSPVPFFRPRNLQSLPMPVPKGSLNPLWEVLNLNPAHRPLVAGWLLNALHPHGPYLVASLNGEQGSAKSCAARILRSLVDPSAIPLRSPPRDERDLLVSAGSNWILTLDNLSVLPGWLSDALCRIATGGGHAARQLFTDGEEFSLSVKRPVILTGIEDVATRPDLAERALQLELEPIPDSRRMPEATLWRKVEQARPIIFSALVEGIVRALRDVGQVTLDRLPRMADAALWVTAAEPAFGWQRGTFVSAFWENLHEGAASSIEANPVGVAVCQLMAQRQEWAGEPAELLKCLEKVATEEQKRNRSWPQTPRALSGSLRRLAQALRRGGYILEFNRGKRRSIRLCKAAESASGPTPATPPASTDDASDAGDAGDAELLPLHGLEPEDPSDTAYE